LPSSPALQPFRSHLLVQRLYKHKVDHMIREPATALSRCTQCGEIFSAPYRHKLKCEVELRSEGDPLAAAFRRHILDRGWKVQRSAGTVVILDMWCWLCGFLIWNRNLCRPYLLDMQHLQMQLATRPQRGVQACKGALTGADHAANMLDALGCILSLVQSSHQAYGS